ncbi:MAG TPA: hypothetical protein VF013_07225 [Candidatus Limnocylindria bacterium]
MIKTHPIRPARIRRHLAHLTVIGAAGVFGLALVAAMQAAGHVATDGGGLSGNYAAAVPAPAIAENVRLPGEAYDLAFDAVANRLWLAIMQRSGPDQLVAVTTDGLEQQTWLLPDADYGGFVSRVKVGDGGNVWVTQPYRLIRFDTKTETFTFTEFDREVPDAFANALDPGNPLPGTWISAIAPDGIGILVARNNVPYLLELDAQLKEVGRRPIPDEYAGAQDLALAADGTVWAISGPTAARTVALLAANGDVVTTVGGGGIRLEAADGRVIALGVSNGSAELAPDGTVNPGPAIGRSDESRVATYGTTTVIYDAGTATVSFFAGDELVGRLEFDEVSVEVPNPAGGVVIGRMRPRVNDVATDGQGRGWYLDGNAHTLVRLSW